MKWRNEKRKDKESEAYGKWNFNENYEKLLFQLCQTMAPLNGPFSLQVVLQWLLGFEND